MNVNAKRNQVKQKKRHVLPANAHKKAAENTKFSCPLQYLSYDNAGAAINRPQRKGEIIMDFYKVPIGFGIVWIEERSLT